MIDKNNNVEKNEEKKKRKVLAAILFATAILLLIGTIAAFFSDMLNDSRQVTSSTLNIEGEYTFYLNGDETQLASITNLNPGDVILITANITNIGNQSAWLREKITLDLQDEALLSNFAVYQGEFTQEDILEDENIENYALPLSATGVAVGANKVIDGTGDDAQTESGEDFNYLETNTYTFAITVYFRHSATNAAQGKNFNLTVSTQALQFKNNNSDVPDELAWNTVVAA